MHGPRRPVLFGAHALPADRMLSGACDLVRHPTHALIQVFSKLAEFLAHPPAHAPPQFRSLDRNNIVLHGWSGGAQFVSWLFEAAAAGGLNGLGIAGGIMTAGVTLTPTLILTLTRTLTRTRTLTLTRTRTRTLALTLTLTLP